MDIRKITVFSTQTNKRTDFDSSATTWGELQCELSDLNISIENMIAVENKNKTNLVINEAILPEESFVLFLSPNTKIKSGVNWKTMGYNELRKHAASIGVSTIGTTIDICERIERWEAVNGKSESSDEILNEKFPTLAAKLDAFIKHVDSNFKESAEYGLDEYTPFKEAVTGEDNNDLRQEAEALGI